MGIKIEDIKSMTLEGSGGLCDKLEDFNGLQWAVETAPFWKEQKDGSSRLLACLVSYEEDYLTVEKRGNFWYVL